MDEKSCWVKYAAHLKSWYAGTYKSTEGATQAINDGRKIQKTFLAYNENTTYERLKARGVSEYATRTIMLYYKNTYKSYMSRCVAETGGFSPDVACMSDSDCPRGYRCRGLGKDSECIEEGEAYEAPGLPIPDLPSLPDMPDGKNIVKGLQVSALVVIGVVLIIIYMLTGKGKKGIQA